MYPAIPHPYQPGMQIWAALFTACLSVKATLGAAAEGLQPSQECAAKWAALTEELQSGIVGFGPPKRRDGFPLRLHKLNPFREARHGAKKQRLLGLLASLFSVPPGMPSFVDRMGLLLKPEQAARIKIAIQDYIRELADIDYIQNNVDQLLSRELLALGKNLFEEKDNCIIAARMMAAVVIGIKFDLAGQKKLHTHYAELLSALSHEILVTRPEVGGTVMSFFSRRSSRTSAYRDPMPGFSDQQGVGLSSEEYDILEQIHKLAGKIVGPWYAKAFGIILIIVLAAFAALGGLAAIQKWHKKEETDEETQGKEPEARPVS